MNQDIAQQEYYFQRFQEQSKRVEYLETVIQVMQRALGWQQLEEEIVLSRVIHSLAKDTYPVHPMEILTDQEREILSKEKV